MKLRYPLGLSDWRAFRRPYARPQTHPQARHYYHVSVKRFRKTLAARHASADDLRWCIAHDMYPTERALYNWADHEPAHFLTDVEQPIIGVIAGRRLPLFRDKVLMQSMLGHLVAMPQIFGLYVNGKPDPAFAQAVSGQVFVKPIDKYRGIGGMTLDAAEVPNAINAALKDHASILVSEVIEQHQMFQSLSPFSVNTVKVITIREPNTRGILPIAAVMRAGTAASSPVDNFGRGGVAFGLDMDTGRIGIGVRKKSPSERLRHHPDTGDVITGRHLPFLGKMIEKSCWLHSQMPLLNFVGWDMTISSDGELLLIEANPHADVDILQAHRPLLGDPRVRAFFEHHGVI